MRVFTTIAVFIFICCSVHADNAAHLKWPDRGADPYPCPKPQFYDLLNARFEKASRIPLGTAEDVAAICEAIHNYKQQLLFNPELSSLFVREVRWLSSTVVMASADTTHFSLCGADYYYVLTLRGKTWRVLTYYMLSIRQT
jgi:hypothetical protein